MKVSEVIAEQLNASINKRTWLDIIYNVKEYGAKGDGATDDTVAIQSVINSAQSSGGVVFFPKGRYLISSTITITLGGSGGTSNLLGIRFEGIGEGSIILHNTDTDLFKFTGNIIFLEVLNLKIISSSSKNSGIAFHFTQGLSKSRFQNIRYGYDIAGHEPFSFFVCDSSYTSDTVSFIDCYLEVIKGVGYQIGQGSSIWIMGGRVIGNGANSTSKGLYLTGGNGGVWTWGTDFISHGTGIYIAKDNGITNREVFISQAACDSCNIGIYINDNSYVSIEGIWAASCKDSNVTISNNATGCIVDIVGGTIFNAGVITGGNGNGIVINAGYEVNITGVAIRNNVANGVNIPAAGIPTNILIASCLIHSNGWGVSLNGNVDLFDNHFFSNTTNISLNGGTTYQIKNNRGVNTGVPVPSGTPALPATGTPITNNTNYPIDVYIRGGTVSTVWIGGSPVFTGTNVCAHLEPGQNIQVDYSAAPNWVWFLS